MIVRKPEAERRLGKKLAGRKTDWFLLSSAGTRNLGGPYRAKEDAEARERQVQFFKHQMRNPLKKIAEMHPDDRALVGSAVGSAAAYAISPAVAPLGAAAGHLAARKVGQRKKNPPPARKRKRSLRTIGLEIKESWDRPWTAPQSDRVATRIRNIVDTMITLCDIDDVPEGMEGTGVTGQSVIGDFLANAGPWHGPQARRIKDELRGLWRQKNPRKKKMGPEEAAMIGAAAGGVAGATMGPTVAPVTAAIGGYAGAKAAQNPKPFMDREHNWKEVLIQKDGKKVTRKKILDYYLKNAKKIWPFIEGQTVMIVLGTKKNEFPRLRKRPDGKYIKLTKLEGIDDPRSFEYWIYRRTIEFHPVLTGKRTPILWLDIDIHARTKAKKTALRKKARDAIPKLRRIMRKFGVERIHAYDSGIGGYHLEGNLKAPKNVDKLRREFTAALKDAFANDPIFTTGIAKSGQIRLDTTTMHTLGSLRAPYSFTVAGGTKKPIRGTTK